MGICPHAVIAIAFKPKTDTVEALFDKLAKEYADEWYKPEAEERCFELKEPWKMLAKGLSWFAEMSDYLEEEFIAPVDTVVFHQMICDWSDMVSMNDLGNIINEASKLAQEASSKVDCGYEIYYGSGDVGMSISWTENDFNFSTTFKCRCEMCSKIEKAMIPKIAMLHSEGPSLFKSRKDVLWG